MSELSAVLPRVSYLVTRLSVWVLPILLTTLTPLPATAQDCSSLDWDDIDGWRHCLQEHGLDGWGSWTLHHAASATNNPTIVRLLLDAGGNSYTPDDCGLTPLHWGAQNSNPIVVSHLIAAGADLHAGDSGGYTSLHFAAAQSGNGRVINLLLRRGAGPSAESNDGRTQLHPVLRCKADSSVVAVLIEAGAGASLTAVHPAALDGNDWTVEKLLADGVDPNARGRYGWPPLHFAVPFSRRNIVATLLDAGANPNARSVAGGTPLHLVGSQASEVVVSQILRAGAAPGPIDEAEGRAPLHYAAEYSDDPAVIRALVNAGSDPALRNDFGQRPLDLARSNDAVIGTAAYPRLVVDEPEPLTAGAGRSPAESTHLTELDGYSRSTMSGDIPCHPANGLS